jgi:hypothetical protein
MANVQFNATNPVFEIVLREAGCKAIHMDWCRRNDSCNDDEDAPYPDAGDRYQISLWDMVRIFGVRAQDGVNKFFEDEISLVSQG